MFFPSSSLNWLWAKRLGLTSENLLQITIKETDSARVALLYQSSKLIVLSTANGSVIRSQSNTALKCNLGCNFVYDSAIITFVGVVVNSGTTAQYAGIFQFNPDNSLASNSISKITYPGYNLLNPVITATSDSRFLMGAYSSSGGVSLILGMPNDLSIIDHIASLLPNTKIRKICFAFSPTRRVFAYLQDLGTPNQFFQVRYVLDYANPTSELNFVFKSTANTRIDFLDMIATSSYTTYILVYLVTSKQVVFFDTWQQASDYVYSYTATQLLITSSVLSLSNGKVQPGSFNLYVGGNNAQNVVSISAKTEKISFIYSFQQAESSQKIQAQSVIASMPVTDANRDFMTIFAEDVSFSRATTDTFSNQALTIQNFVTPTIPDPPVCATEVNPSPTFPLSITLYVGDTLSFTHSIAPFTVCTLVTCAYTSRTSIPLSSVSLAYSNLASQITTLDGALDNQVFDLRFFAQPDESFLSSCALFYAHYTLTVLNVLINYSFTMSDIYYNISSGPMDTGFPMFTNSKGITGDSKLDIIIKLVKSDGSAYNASFITAFDLTNRVITINTNDYSAVRTNPMKIVAFFSYRPSKTVELPFTIYLEKCFQTIISHSPMERMIYQTGQPVLIQFYNAFSNTFGSDCGPFFFTATYTPSPAITFDPALSKFSVETSSSSADGRYLVSLTAALKQPLTNAVYKSATISTEIMIFDPSITYLIPIQVDFIEYFIKDPEKVVILPSIPSTKGYLSAQYQIFNANGSSIDSSLMKFDPFSRKFFIKSSDPAQMKVYELTY